MGTARTGVARTGVRVAGYAELRDTGSATWLTRDSAWAVSRFDAVQTVLGDWERFTSVSNPGLEPQQPYMPKGGILGSDRPTTPDCGTSSPST